MSKFPLSRQPKNVLMWEIFILLTDVCNNIAYALLSSLLRRHEFLFRHRDDTTTTSDIQNSNVLATDRLQQRSGHL